MYDEVWFDEQMPGLPSECRRFQTKTLDRCMDRYRVTKAGRLCWIANVLLEDISSPESQPEGDAVDIDFHGDLRLVSDDGKSGPYVARFTHGALEWIKPEAEAPHVTLRRAR